MRLIFSLAALGFLITCRSSPAENLQPNLIPGEIVKNTDIYGSYYLYQPTTLSNPPKTLVVIHGTPAKELSGGETAYN
ncbi:MAG: hypothetical protein HQ574_09220 [Chloroflexi bacterium]|nr:hypothetical protein [Chloroflexota bacterium]